MEIELPLRDDGFTYITKQDKIKDANYYNDEFENVKGSIYIYIYMSLF